MKTCLLSNPLRFSPPLIAYTALPCLICEGINAYLDELVSEGRFLDKDSDEDRVVYQQSVNVPYHFYAQVIPTLSVDDRATFFSAPSTAQKVYTTLVQLASLHRPNSLLSSFSTVMVPHPLLSPADRAALLEDNEGKTMLVQGQAVVAQTVWQLIPENGRLVLEKHVAGLLKGASTGKIADFISLLPPPE